MAGTERAKGGETEAPAWTVERLSATRARVRGREVLWFAGCDYLGLAHHPEVVGALIRAAETYGISASASPSTTGTSPAHVELEQQLARFLGTEDALLTADGYLSNLVALQALAPELDGLLLERGSHTSLRDAARAAGLPVRAFADVDEARTLLDTGLLGRVGIATDGCFPAARRIAPLGALAALLDAGSAYLVVDDSHGLGVLGEGGRGTCEHFGVRHPRVVVTGTLSKGLGAFGGFVACARSVVHSGRARAAAWSGATPIPPALARAGIAALAIVEREPERRTRLRAHVVFLRALFQRLGLPLSDYDNPVFTFTLPTAEAMRAVHARLLDAGFLVPYVVYPDGLGGYLRIALGAEHSAAEVAALGTALEHGLRR